MKVYRLRANSDGDTKDYKGREYMALVDDYGNVENIIEQVNVELEPFGIQLLLGSDGGDYWAIRAEQMADKSFAYLHRREG